MRAVPDSLLTWLLVFLYLGTVTIAQERPRIVGAPVQQSTPYLPAQPDDILRTRTRVVFIDALVRDQATNEPVRNLNVEDFQVLDDGNPRRLSYFSRQGDSRRPLALLLFIDLWTQYGRSLLKSDEAMRRLADALKKLAPEDQVAVMVTWVDEGAEPGTPVPTTRMIADFTRDRQSVARALLSIPDLVKQQEKQLDDLAERRSRDAGDLRLDIVWRLPEIAFQIVPLAARFPRSQMVVVGVIDDLFDLKKGEREAAIAEALRANIIFNGLIFNKSFAAKIFFGTFNKLFMSPRGLSVHAAGYLARETGGEVVSVGRPADLQMGLERFVRDLMARYNLGFSLDEHEPEEERLHKLAVKTNLRDSRGRVRKLVVRARRGYYIPKAQKMPVEQ